MAEPLDSLHAQVTEAILRAERLPSDSSEARAAFVVVARIEEAIAECTSPNEVIGEIARFGAVTAWLSAGKPAFAIHAANRYLAEELTEIERKAIVEIRDEAVRILGQSGSSNVT